MPDYADTVIWFMSPVPYPETGLSPQLVARLEAWEAAYYDALTPDFEWVSPDSPRALNDEGRVLADAVAAEIGVTPEVAGQHR